MPTETLTYIRLQIPDELFKAYEQTGLKDGRPAEEVMTDRLRSSMDQQGWDGSVTLSPDERQRLETALHRGFNRGADLVTYIENSVTCTVDGIDIKLNPECVRRLRSRAGMTPYKEYLRRIFTSQLEHLAGMR